MNDCKFIGTVGCDPKTNDSKTAINFSMALNEGYFDKKTNEFKKTTTWIELSAFGTLVKTIEQYVKKGMKLCVTTKVVNSEYTDRSGNQIKKTSFRIKEMEFVESAKKTQEREEKQNEGFLNIPDQLEEEMGVPFT